MRRPRALVWACCVAAFLLAVAAMPAQDRLGNPLPNGAVSRLGTTRLRYGRPVADICYLPDGRGIVAIDTRIEIWDLAHGKMLSEHKIAGDRIVDICPRLDGEALLIAQRDGQLHEWDLINSRDLHSWPTGQESLRCVSYSPDRKRVLTIGSVPPTIKEWELASGKELIAITGTKQAFFDGIYGPGGKSVIVGGGYKFILSHHDLASGKELKEWCGDYAANDLQLSADGERLLIGYHYRASEYRLEDYQHLRSFTGPLGGAVNAARYCKNGDDILTSSRDGSITRWDRKQAKAQLQWFPHQCHVRRIEVSPDGERVLSSGGWHDGHTVVESSLATGQCLLPWKRHTGVVQAVAALPSGDRAVSGSDDGTLRIWDLETGECLKVIHAADLGVLAVAVSPEGKRLAAGCADGSVREFSLPDARPLRTLHQHLGYVRSVAYKNNEPIGPHEVGLFSSADDGAIRGWDAVHSQWACKVFQGHRGGVLSIAVSEDNKRAASGGRDGTVRIWHLETDPMMHTYQEPLMHTYQADRGWVEAVCFTPDGRYVLSAGRHGRILKRDLETGEVVAEMLHGDWVRALVCTPDGRTVCAGGEDNTITCWDLATGERTATLTGHEGDVLSLAITLDGKRLISASQDTTLLIWELP